MIQTPDAMEPSSTPEWTPERMKNSLMRVMENWSIETTMPKPADIEALRTHLPSGKRVYLSALPDTPPGQLAEQIRQIANAGFEPVPHLVVRNFTSRDQMMGFLRTLHLEARVRRVLVVAGDRGVPAGPFSSALQFIDSGILQEIGISQIGIAGYPEGHPNISHEDLSDALQAKVVAARCQQLEVEVVTQFSFDAKAIMSWLFNLRHHFPELPVRIGLAGPATRKTLFKFALRCGVKATAKGLGRGLSLVGNMKDKTTPARIVQTMADGWSSENGHEVSLHFFSFGGTASTAKWAQSLGQGEIPL